MNRFCQETMQHKELSKSFALNLNLNVGWSDLSVWTHDDLMRLPRDRSRWPGGDPWCDYNWQDSGLGSDTRGKLCKYKQGEYFVSNSVLRNTNLKSAVSQHTFAVTSACPHVHVRAMRNLYKGSLHSFEVNMMWVDVDCVWKSFDNRQEVILDKWMWHCWWLMMSWRGLSYNW